MIAIIDYGLGNIKAFLNIYKSLNIDAAIVKESQQLKEAKKIILPGVGAFDWAMQRLNSSGLRDTLDQMVLDKKTPVLGVCVGMQMMFCESEEGSEKGLSWINGHVEKFQDQELRLPQMGWNSVAPTHSKTLFKEIEDPQFYFLHSFLCVPHDTGHTLSTTTYGHTFTSAINNGNIYGTQFHPEKSHHWGVKLLKNFGEC